MTREELDAIVVGSGPNGLAAAITLARAGWAVRLYEANDVVGGGLRGAELTLPGFLHDICAAVHPLAVSSPFFASLPFGPEELEWLHAEYALAHPFDDGSAGVLARSLDQTCQALDAAPGSARDGAAWRRLLEPFVAPWPSLAADILRPLRIPRHPLRMAHFGLHAFRSAASLVRAHFAGREARALFAGGAAHSLVSLTAPPTAAFGLTLAIAAHAVGWPIARGGSQRIADALTRYFRALGGEVVTGTRIDALSALPPARAVLLDVSPREFLRLAGDRLPNGYRDALARYRYGPGAFKVDWALSEPIPWHAGACRRAGTVHVGGTLEEIIAAEEAPLAGRVPERPFVLVGQPTLCDASRAPARRHVAWGYCHVPNGFPVGAADPTRAVDDVLARLEAQIERFAPGFRDIVLARHVMPPTVLEGHNPNVVGGDIAGGAMSLGQLFFRPVTRWNPYRTPLDGVYLCSASTPPGGAVHGMCGYYAARTVLRQPLTPPEFVNGGGRDVEREARAAIGVGS